MRILFITATRLGDAVLSTGLLNHLLETYPQARFTIACGPVARGVFVRMPRLDGILVVDKWRFDLHWLILWGRVAGRFWDLVIDLRGSALSLCVVARRRAIMRGGRRPGHRLTHIAGILGLDPAPLPVAWIGAADEAAAARLLPAGGALVGLGPTANWEGKIWPAERFAALFAVVAGRLPGARAVVFGGPGDTERLAAQRLLDLLPGAIDLVGRLSVPEAAACLSWCDVFVGNDSGLMHLSASTGTPTLGLFGPTPAGEYAPAGRATAVALADGPPGGAAMQELPVSVAALAAFDLLARAERMPAVRPVLALPDAAIGPA